MRPMGSKKQSQQSSPPKEKTPTFLLELPLVADAGQAAHLGGHLEVGRQFYNAMLSAGQQRLRRMKADPAWQAARAIPRTHKLERRGAFSAPRGRHRFSLYALPQLAPKPLRGRLAAQLEVGPAPQPASHCYHPP